METIIKIAQFLLSLSILVTLHELGHFTFAKLFKARVEKFYIFFNPFFSLFKFKYGETEYGMGWLPLGGYVKISGMIDESMDKEQMKQPAKAYEFRSKPAWQRLIIMLAGVMVNIALAFVIYIAVLFYWGEEYLPSKNLPVGIKCGELMKSIGLEDGDIIYALDNNEVERFSEIIPDIMLKSPKTMQIIRDKKEMSLDIPASLVPALLEQSSKSFEYNPLIMPRIAFKPFIIGAFAENAIIEKAGAKIDDEIISIDGIEFKAFDEFTSYVKSKANSTLSMALLRNGEIVNISLTLDEKASMGVGAKNRKLFDTETKEYTLLEAIPAGVVMTVDKMSSYLSSLKLMFNSENKAYKSVGGFISIGNIFPSYWDWRAFWNLTAFLSVILGIMNLLPIPALDGGHVMFLLYEIITGRKPGDKFMEYAQMTGMLILFGLLILANANDIIKLLH